MNRRSFFQMLSAFVPVAILAKLAPSSSAVFSLKLEDFLQNTPVRYPNGLRDLIDDSKDWKSLTPLTEQQIIAARDEIVRYKMSDSALGYIGSRQQYFGPLSVEEQIEKDAMRDMAKHIERLYLG